MQVNNLVRLVETGDPKLDNQEGLIVGFHGEDFPIVKFNQIPEGYNPVICISKYCLRQL